MRVVLPLIVALFISAVSQCYGDDRKEFDYEEILRTLSWQFRFDHETVLYSVHNFRDDYQVEIIKENNNPWDMLTIQLTKNDQEVYSWKGHEYSAFIEFNDRLYYADYNPLQTGCTVVAYALKEGKQLWKTELKGLGPISHSKYFNKAQMTFWEGFLVIYGNEAAGKYLELLDLKTGKSVGNKVLDE